MEENQLKAQQADVLESPAPLMSPTDTEASLLDAAKADKHVTGEYTGVAQPHLNSGDAVAAAQIPTDHRFRLQDILINGCAGLIPFGANARFPR